MTSTISTFQEAYASLNEVVEELRMHHTGAGTYFYENGDQYRVEFALAAIKGITSGERNVSYLGAVLQIVATLDSKNDGGYDSQFEAIEWLAESIGSNMDAIEAAAG